MIFSLCHTTARLPFDWAKALIDWRDKCDHPENVEYVLTFDADKIDRVHLTRVELESWGRFVVGINHGRHSAAAGWNVAAANSSGEFLITVSDDWFPPEHWDTEITKVLREHFGWWDPSSGPVEREAVLDVDNQDGSSPLLPFSLLTRKYYLRYGYLFYPEYWGMMADTEFTEVARRDNVVIDARHLKFTHLNPENGSVEWDDTYRWQRREEAQRVGKEVFARRLKEGFPKPEGQLVGA